MQEKNLHAVLFPGEIDTSERSLEEITSDWFDADRNLVLGGKSSAQHSVRIAPTTIEPCSKLVFGVTKDGKYHYLGSTKSIDTYTDLADYIYSPPNPQTHIYTQSVSHQVNPTPYNFEPNPVNISKGEHPVAYMRFADRSEAPTKPSSHGQEEDSSVEFQQISEALSRLFEEKPIWQRSALDHRLNNDYNIKISDWKLGKTIRKFAYFFLDGPWRSTYVRFGYDPRTDPEARHWQMIDFRLPSTGGPFAERGRSQLYQLCDLEDPVVRALVEKQPQVQVPHPQFGWINPEDVHSIRNQLKLRSAESLRRVLPS